MEKRKFGFSDLELTKISLETWAIGGGNWSFGWVLRRPEVIAAIVGARRPSQIEGTVPAANWELSEEVIAEIDRLLLERDQAVEREIA